jgi:pyrroloquinoline-quinone synthase
MDFWNRLDQVRAENDVLKHSFYVRWSAGELTGEELARYAGEYRHAVVALADAASGAAAAATDPALRAELSEHAAEEAEHVALWDKFASAVGGSRVTQPLPETARCAATWAGERGRPLLDSLVAIYAIEAGQPAISQTKLQGLRAHYGVDETEYFDVHVERDVEHAAAGRALIEQRLDGAAQDRLLAQAGAVLRANWRLLDGVERG